MKYDERHFQLHSGEYDWLVTELTQNTRGEYVIILLLVLITPTKYGLTLLELGIH